MLIKQLITRIFIISLLLLNANLVIANETNSINKAQIDSFLNVVKTEMPNNWQPPSGKNMVQAIVNLNNEGKIIDTKITSTPDNKAAKASALKAIQATKFPKLAISPDSKIILTLGFDSNFSAQGDGKAGMTCKLEVRQVTKIITKTPKK